MVRSNCLQIGLNARLFANNWRPILNEIAFAAAHGFTALQFPGKEDGLASTDLGAEISLVRDALEQTGIVAVMEIMIRVDTLGYSASGRTLIEILTANLPAITGLNCQCVHIHFTPLESVAPAMLPDLEERLLPSLAAGARLGQDWGFQFGFEHNEPAIGLFGSPQLCIKAVSAIPKLAFVWDMNHTHPNDLQSFTAILPRVSMVHVSDTRLPDLNEHLPLGLGTIDFTHYCQLLREHGFQGPAILEIGGLPKSGGYNRDTDAALVESLGRLRSANTGSLVAR
jgi:L-ribulose-5-phosphate 3-epimerase